MGKIFITDEVNDTYVAQVTSGKRVRVETGNSSYVILSSAHTLISGQNIATGACFLKSLIFGEVPASATQINIYDTSMSASHISAFGTSGANIIAMIGFEPTAGALSAARLNFPFSMPFDVYCASGITVSIGASAAGDAAGRIGAMRNISVTYQQ